MQIDTVERLGNSLIQHGSLNDRVYLMKLDRGDVPEIIDRIEALALENRYSKLFAKMPADAEDAFLKRGYEREAAVPGMYNRTMGGVFLSKFLSPERRRDEYEAEVRKNIAFAKKKAGRRNAALDSGRYVLRKARTDDIESICGVYKKVFESYPFPIHQPAYIEQAMRSNTLYYLMEDEGRIIAVASADIDAENRNVEMTDFSTLPDFRSEGLAQILLLRLEAKVIEEGVTMAYTIARALSRGINITFAKNGYHFAGTLVNNTNIAGKIESMNVWYKSLPGEGAG